MARWQTPSPSRPARPSRGLGPTRAGAAHWHVPAAARPCQMARPGPWPLTVARRGWLASGTMALGPQAASAGLAHRAGQWPSGHSHPSHLPNSMLASVYVLVFFHRKMKLALLSNASHWKVALPLRFSGNVRTFEALQVPQEFVHLVLHGN